MTNFVRRTRGILLIAWAISMLLSSVAPSTRILTGIPGSGRWPIYAAVGVMLITWYLIRKAESSMFLSLLMSASAITVGGAVGMLAIGLASGKATPLLFAAKWATIGLVTSIVFIRQFKVIEKDTLLDPLTSLPSAEELSKMSAEDRKGMMDARFAEIETMTDKLKADNRRTWTQAALLLIIGAVAYGSSIVFRPEIERAKPIASSAQVEQP